MDVFVVYSCSGPCETGRDIPPNGDALSESPEQVQLLFNEPIEAEFDPLKAYDQGGDRVDEDDARVSPNNRKLLIIDLNEELPEGFYTVDWRVTSADGHPVSGTRKFAVDASAVGGGGEPIEPIERSAEQEEAGGVNTHIIHIVVLGLGALVALGAGAAA